MQAVVLVAGWLATFGLVRGTFADAIEDRIVAQNTELAERVAALLPELPERVAFGGDDWERAQRVIEGLDELPAGGFACIIDADGRILCHPEIRRRPELLGSDLSGEILELPATAGVGVGTEADDAPARRRRLADLGDASASGRIAFGPGDVQFVATRTLEDSPYRLLVHQPVAGLVQAGEASTRIVLVAAAGSLVAVLGLAGGGLLILVRGYEGELEHVNRRLQGEIDVAHDIQQATLPRTLPGLGELELAGWSEAAEETGGDTWDVIPLAEPGRDPHEPSPALLMLADATGHGVGPALSVTQLRAMLRIAARTETDVVRIAEIVNRQLHADLPGSRFITAWIARVDPVGAALQTISAGQAPILRYDAATDRVTIDAADTWPLGVLDGLGTVTANLRRLEPGDVLVVPSDGLVEARNARGAMLGDEGLAAALLAAARAGLDAEQILDGLRSAVAAHAHGPADDDRTAIVLRRPA